MLGGLQGPLLCNLRERGITMILILAVLAAGRKRKEPAADELQKGEKA